MGQPVREKNDGLSMRGADSAREHQDAKHKGRKAGEYGQEADSLDSKVNNDFSEAMHRALKGKLG